MVTVKDADDYFHSYFSCNFLPNHGLTRADKIFCPAQNFGIWNGTRGIIIFLY